MWDNAVLVAIPIVSAVVATLVGIKQVHALRERTGDKSLLTAILSFDFDGQKLPAKKPLKNG